MLSSESAEESLEATPSETESRVLVKPEPPSSGATPSSVKPSALANALLKAEASADSYSDLFVDQTERRSASISPKKSSMMLSRTKSKSSPSQLSNASNWMGEVNLLLSRISTPVAVYATAWMVISLCYAKVFI